MIFLVIIFLSIGSVLVVSIIWDIVIYLLKFKFNKAGVRFTYFLQARWELFRLETNLQVVKIKAKEKREQVLEPVEEYTPLAPVAPVEDVITISLDREVYSWDVRYSDNKNNPQWKSIPEKPLILE